MNPSIARVRRLSTRHIAHALTQQTSTATTRQSFALSRGIATTCAARGTNTDWIRKKIWQGDAPGAADPYTQRPDEVNPNANNLAASETNNLPDEALEMHHEQPIPEAILDSRLPLPPRRSEATAERNVAASDPSYVPATTMDGLEHITPISQWWEQPGNWGEESAFQAFASAEKVTNAAAVEVYLRRALVEALALQQTGALEEWATLKWREGGRADLDAALAVEISVQDGVAAIKGDAAAVADSVTSDVETAEVAKVAADEAQAIVAGWDASWKEAALNDQIKFALRKRLYQLTGKLLPDAKLGAANTVQDLLTLAVRPPKAKSLAEELEAAGKLDGLANVAMHSRRITPIDKEVAVGRWKVIEEELAKRDLPATGHGDVGRNRERDRIIGRI